MHGATLRGILLAMVKLHCVSTPEMLREVLHATLQEQKACSTSAILYATFSGVSKMLRKILHEMLHCVSGPLATWK